MRLCISLPDLTDLLKLNNIDLVFWPIDYLFILDEMITFLLFMGNFCLFKQSIYTQHLGKKMQLLNIRTINVTPQPLLIVSERHFRPRR